MMNRLHKLAGRGLRFRVGFTLVELLIVLSIFLVLTAIALPTVKGLIDDQKGSRSAQSMSAFLNMAQSRAIAEGRYVGVRIERLDSSTGFGRVASIRLRQLTGVPPYSGDAADAVAQLFTSGTGGINRANFAANDSPLLLLSSNILNNELSPGVPNLSDDHLSPIRIGDLLELPGGRTVPITGISGTGPITVSFNLFEPDSGAATFPTAARAQRNSAGDPVKFRIHRSPVPSSVTTLSLPRGVAVDLNFSGVGLAGNQFAPASNLSVAANNIDIIFGPNGDIVSVNSTGISGPPLSNIYLCIGRTDGVVPTGGDLFQDDSRSKSNLRNLESTWLVINPKTGKSVASPFASIATIPTDTTDLTVIGVALTESRRLAALSETLDASP